MLPIYELTFWIFKAIQEYEDVLDKILDYIRKIQREKNINDNYDIEEIKTNLTMFIQFYGKEKCLNMFKNYISLAPENRKYFLMNLIFDKTKIHERVKIHFLILSFLGSINPFWKLFVASLLFFL